MYASENPKSLIRHNLSQNASFFTRISAAGCPGLRAAFPSKSGGKRGKGLAPRVVGGVSDDDAITVADVSERLPLEEGEVLFNAGGCKGEGEPPTSPPDPSGYTQGGGEGEGDREWGVEMGIGIKGDSPQIWTAPSVVTMRSWPTSIFFKNLYVCVCFS